MERIEIGQCLVVDPEICHCFGKELRETVPTERRTEPVRLLGKLAPLVVFERIAPVIYQADEKFPVYVLVPTELPLEPRNFPLLLMGKEEQRRNVIEAWMREGQEKEVS